MNSAEMGIEIEFIQDKVANGILEIDFSFRASAEASRGALV